MHRFAPLLLCLAACNRGSDSTASTDSGSSGTTDASATQASASGSTSESSQTSVTESLTGATSSSSDSSADESSSSTGDPGPTSMFCQCSTNNPAPDAGSFEMCAELLADGSGTYYEAPPYTRTPDAETQGGVPPGTVTGAMFTTSAVYPGNTWSYWVYVPAQYDGSAPAALFVLTDGGVYQDNGDGAPYRTPTVLDNLIAEGAMPVTIAVFVDPGFDEQGNSTRSLEYDTPDDSYVTFLLDELLPVAVGDYVITDDPALRAIGGRSSGGAASFTAGWERPDAFGLLYTTLGSFTQLAANDLGEFSDRYPALIGSEPAKQLRVTLLSGINDLDNRFGNWRDAHMAMTTALDCAGYTYRSGFGESEHADDSHPFDEFGNDLRWLFADAI